MHLPWRDVPPYPGAAPISTSLLAEDADALAAAACGEHVLEVGSAYGYSAAVMLHAGAKSLTAVDPHTWIPGSLEAVQRNAPKAMTLVNRFDEAAPALHGRQFGLIFIDGDHSAEAVEHDINAALPLLEPGGVLAVHDYLEDCCCPDVRTVVDRMFPGQGIVKGSTWMWWPQ